MELNGFRKTGEFLRIKPISVNKIKRVKIKNNWVPCYDLTLKISGSKHAKEVLFYTGIGEKNKLGFGMIGEKPNETK